MRPTSRIDRFALACVASAALGGCGHTTAAHVDAMVPGVTYPPYPAAHVDLREPLPVVSVAARDHVQLIAGMPSRTCEVIGIVGVDARPGDGEAALEELRTRAAAMGADAVVHVRAHVEDAAGASSVSGDPEWEAVLDEAAGTYESTLHVSGEAVRYRDVVDGRHYQVVGHVNVMDRPGHEHEALERLAARARMMHADLVIDIEVTHTGGDAPFEVHGTAIRFLE